MRISGTTNGAERDSVKRNPQIPPASGRVVFQLTPTNRAVVFAQIPPASCRVVFQFPPINRAVVCAQIPPALCRVVFQFPPTNRAAVCAQIPPASCRVVFQFPPINRAVVCAQIPPALCRVVFQFPPKNSYNAAQIDTGLQLPLETCNLDQTGKPHDTSLHSLGCGLPAPFLSLL
jgi:hypothetical protein